jgi:hypothetical protein
MEKQQIGVNHHEEEMRQNEENESRVGNWR